MRRSDLHQKTSLTTSTVTDDNELATDFSHFSVIIKNISVSIQPGIYEAKMSKDGRRG